MISKKTYRLVLALVFLCPAFAFVSVQNNKAFEGLRKLNEKYRNLKTYSFNMMYVTYPNYTSQVAAQKSSGNYIKKGEQVYSNLEGVQTLQTKNLLIIVIEKEKKVLIAKPQKDVIANSKMDGLEKALAQKSELKLSEENGKQVYKVVFKDKSANYEAMNIYEGKGNLLEKMVMYYGIPLKLYPDDAKCKEEKPRMEIFYTDFTEQVAETNKLTEDYYVIKKGKEYQLNERLKNYTLINNYY